MEGGHEDGGDEAREQPGEQVKALRQGAGRMEGRKGLGRSRSAPALG